jgi:putative transposase
MAPDEFKPSTHAPAHLYRAGAWYLITGATYQRLPHLVSDQRKKAWHSAFVFAAERYAWAVKAWVVLPNHYHVIVQAPETDASSLPALVSSYHKFTATRWNVEDSCAGRQVWWNYWDSCLRAEVDYLARWNYVHWNPVRHKLVARPEDYAFSSYRQYLAAAPGDVQHMEQSYPFDEVQDVPDDF